jgi:sugar phosphate isomerase/epimerase
MTSHPPIHNRPPLAAFPKAYLDDLCVTGDMSLGQWFELVALLEVDGTELYAGALELADPQNWPKIRSAAGELGLALPMLCCSPDFTHNDRDFRREQIEREKFWITMCAELGGTYCRVLTGQGRPDVSRDDGIRYCVEAIGECIAYAKTRNVVLIIENHYKDPYWEYPEFAQKSDVFCEILNQLPDESLAVNFDPSNALVADEDPLELLDAVIERVATMHASDRYFDDGHQAIAADEPISGYEARLQHGEIGQGLNDYDAIFGRLSTAGFSGWISIEDGVTSFSQLERSAVYLRRKIDEYWPG